MKLIDLIFVIIVFILPLYCRLVIAVLMYWLSVRDQYIQRDPQMSGGLRFAKDNHSYISSDSGVDVQDLFSELSHTSLSHKKALPDCFSSPNEHQVPATSLNGRSSWVEPSSSSWSADSFQEPAIRNNFNPHKPPDVFAKDNHSYISSDSGVDVQDLFSELSHTSLSHKKALPDCFSSPNEHQVPATSLNGRSSWVEPSSSSWSADSFQEPAIRNNFNPHKPPDVFPDMDTNYTKERTIPGSAHMITDLRSELERIEESNEDISKLICKADIILTERQDGAMKSFWRNMSQEYNKLKDASRQSKHQFKIEARRTYPEDQAEEIIHANPSIIRNNHLLKDAEDQLSQLDRVIKARGLDLSPTLTAKGTTIKYPIFDGESLPLINDFLREIESLIIQAGIPVSERGVVLTKSVKGRAKFILRHSFIEKNPSFNDQARILREHFGETAIQMLMIEKWHRKYGPIPMSHDVTQSMSETYKRVTKHVTLIKAAKSLQAAKRNMDNPITHHYLDLLEKLLPRVKREMLCDARGHKTLNTEERFKQLQDAYGQVQVFSSIEVIRGHGTEGPESEHELRPNPESMGFPFDPSVPPPLPIYGGELNLSLPTNCTFH